MNTPDEYLDDDWEPTPDDYVKTFKQIRKSRTEFQSDIKVEDLLHADLDLLAIFFVVATWESLRWYKFDNMKDIIPDSKEYWHQFDMNRVAHTYASQIDTGPHFGDCTCFACSCDRCRAESSYLEAVHLRDTSQLAPLELMAMLLARDHIRVIAEENFQRELHSGPSAVQDHFQENYSRARAKYPGEYCISLKRHTDYWATLTEDERRGYRERARQIREWCNVKPDCPGVPWW